MVRRVPCRACAGNGTSFGARDDQRSLLSGLGSRTTAGRLCFVGREGRDGPLRSLGRQGAARSFVLSAILSLSGIGVGTRLPRKLVCLVIWDAIFPKDGLGGPPHPFHQGASRGWLSRVPPVVSQLQQVKTNSTPWVEFPSETLRSSFLKLSCFQ